MKINGETFNSEIVNVAIFLTTFNIINSFYAAFCVIKKTFFFNIKRNIVNLCRIIGIYINDNANVEHIKV